MKKMQITIIIAIGNFQKDKEFVYVVPDGYELVEENGKYYGVKQVTVTIQATSITDEKGNTAYKPPEGYSMSGKTTATKTTTYKIPAKKVYLFDDANYEEEYQYKLK